MAPIHPKGESLRRAVRFVSDALRGDPEASILSLVDQATLQFDLDPNAAEYLLRFYREVEGRRARQQP